MTIDRYLSELRPRLPGGVLLKRRILDEIRDHLSESARREQSRGLPAEEAERRAVERFGDVDLIASEFAEVLREPQRGVLPLLWLSVSAASVAALFVVLRGAAEPPPAPLSPIAVVEELPPPVDSTSEHMNIYSYVQKSAESAEPAQPAHPCPIEHVRMTRRQVRLLEPAPAAPQPVEEPTQAAPAPELALLDRIRPLLLPSPPPQSGHITHVWSSATPPEPLDTQPDVAVRYPPEARMMAIQGDVRLVLHVGSDGRVAEALVAKGLGYGLDEMALDIARTLRFRPAREPDGRATDGWVTWTIRCHRETDAMAVPVFVDRGTGPRAFVVDKHFRI